MPGKPSSYIVKVGKGAALSPFVSVGLGAAYRYKNKRRIEAWKKQWRKL